MIEKHEHGYEQYVGKYYKLGTSLKDIKKKIDEDIKREIANGTLPKIKYTLRTKYFSGGEELTLIIRDSPEKLYSEPYKKTEFFKNLESKLTAIADEYNYTERDIGAGDYFSTSFYFFVRADDDLMRMIKWLKNMLMKMEGI